MRLSGIILISSFVAACTPVEVFAPDVAFGPVETVRVDGRDYDVREATNDPVLRGALVAVGTDMGEAMVGGGMPRNGAFDYLDTTRVGGAEGRNVAIAVVTAWCDRQGAGLPMDLADAVVRVDPETGEYVFPFRCVEFEQR